MRGTQSAKKENKRPFPSWLLFVGLLGIALAVLFYQSFEPHRILFANDGPLGMMKASGNRFPGRLLGTWRNNWWIGVEAPSAAPTISAILATILSPELYLKIYAPFTLFFVGFCAWVFFRQLEFGPMVCVLGGIAAGLNMHFFSTACWGLGTWNLAAGMIFLALAALSTKTIKQTWAKAILAGLAVGMNLMEGFDVGAILSIYVGIFVLFRAFTEETGFGRKTLTAVFTEVLVVFFAGLIAAHTISSLIGTQIEGVTGTKQEMQTKEERWDFATQWSLPKVETLRLIIPGLFGYRISGLTIQPKKNTSYWGLSGQDPRIPELKSDDPAVRAKVAQGLVLWPEEQQQLDSADWTTRQAAANGIAARTGMFARHTGTGEYAGVLVSLLALFALANSWRGPATSFSRQERRAVWFWGGAATFSLLAAWGRHAFFYKLLYQLPYFSTIRNPIKFLHPFHIAWLILAGYGLEVLHRRYLQNPDKRTQLLPDYLMQWWAKTAGFEKKWAWGCVIVIVASLIGLVIFSASQARLIEYLVNGQFAVDMASRMTAFSLSEVVWFIIYLGLSAGVVIGILSGAWNGRRARSAWIYLGAIMIFDLSRADIPWIHYFDYQEKYSPNEVVNFLAEKKPWEQRVMGRLSPRGQGSAPSLQLGQMYNFWIQNDLPYHDIQSLDFSEMPRVPELDDAYLRNFQLVGTNVFTADLRPAVRLWELTDTRYLLLGAEGAKLLNDRGDPIKHGFRVVTGLRVFVKPGVREIEDAGDFTVEPDPKGTGALIEFTHALPRAKLFAYWQTPTNDAAALATLASPEFDPAQTVLVAKETPAPQAPGDPGSDAGTVTITDYHPRDIKVRADAKTPAILLFNDRWAANWKVLVDRKPEPLLRCNYIMRGVFVPRGEHTIEFRYRPSLTTLYASLGGWVAGILVAGFLVYDRRKRHAPPGGTRDAF